MSNELVILLDRKNAGADFKVNSTRIEFEKNAYISMQIGSRIGDRLRIQFDKDGKLTIEVDFCDQFSQKLVIPVPPEAQQ